MSDRRVHVFVSGRVQGVFYRSECSRLARELGLRGFVRNLGDGRVEAVFEGEEAKLERILAWCREGTSWSEVESVEVSEEPPKGETSFRIA